MPSFLRSYLNTPSNLSMKMLGAFLWVCLATPLSLAAVAETPWEQKPLLKLAQASPNEAKPDQKSSEAKPGRYAHLQQRVIALSQALELRHANNKEQLRNAKQGLAQTLFAWNQLATKSDTNTQELHHWLDDSMKSVMVGRSGKISHPPSFTKSGMDDYRPPTIGQSRSARETSNERSLQKPTRVERRVAKPTTKQSEKSRWSRHPSGAPLDWDDPFTNKNSSRETVTSPFGNPSTTEYEVKRPFFGNNVSVNHSELIAAIRGYNLEVRKVNRRLQRVNQLSVGQLLNISDELERLWNEKAFLNLYLGGLSKEGRRLMPNILSAELAHELVLRQARELLATNALQNQAERSALQGLDQKLSQFK